MSESATTRGYIMDLLGRRTRDYKSRPYKALNGCIQGGAGSILKHKMVVIHRNRKRLGFIPRMTVHDEVCGTAIGGVETKMKMLELLNDMSTYQEHRFPKMAVPIRWDAKVGDNWAVC
jgi:DNA polymerase I-like protein with 3'-5' exonuclease and polymerase domains